MQLRISMHLIRSRPRVNSEDPRNTRRRLAQPFLLFLRFVVVACCTTVLHTTSKSTSVSAANRDAASGSLIERSRVTWPSLRESWTCQANCPCLRCRRAMEQWGKGEMEEWKSRATGAAKIQIFRRSQPPRLSCDLQMRRGHAERSVSRMG